MASLLYTDGSSSIKTGLCGWGLTGMMGSKRIRMAGAMPGTNQLAELTAVVAALNGLVYASSRADEVLPARIISDSTYAIGCMTNFRKKWESNGFLTAAGIPVSHKDLIQLGHTYMDRLAQKIEFVHVRGHKGEAGNEEADLISRFARYLAEKNNTEELLKKIKKHDSTEIVIDFTKFP